MSRIPAMMLALAAATVAFAAPDAGKEPPKMTPEQQAEMDAYMKAATPGPEHQLLATCAGDFDVAVKSWESAGAAPTEDKGTAKRTMMLDGRVLSEEVHSTMMGMPFEGHGMTGFDNATKKYWGTWVDSMGTGMMVSEGTCDAKKSCTFTATFNDPVKKKPVTSRMTTRWPNPTTEVFEMYGPGKDGKEMKMLELTYTKK